MLTIRAEFMLSILGRRHVEHGCAQGCASWILNMAPGSGPGEEFRSSVGRKEKDLRTEISSPEG